PPRPRSLRTPRSRRKTATAPQRGCDPNPQYASFDACRSPRYACRLFTGGGTEGYAPPAWQDRVAFFAKASHSSQGAPAGAIYRDRHRRCRRRGPGVDRRPSDGTPRHRGRHPGGAGQRGLRRLPGHSRLCGRRPDGLGVAAVVAGDHGDRPGGLLPVQEQALMPPRARRFVATVAVVFFLIFWIWGAVTLHALLPKAWWIDLVFSAMAGIGWGVPLIPLLRWAERE